MDITEQLKRDEGLRLTAYKDTASKTTIGYGRNLEDKGISKDEAEYLLDNDIAAVKIAVAEAFPWSTSLNPARLGVLQNMAFNLGVQGLLKFRDMLTWLQGGQYDEAANAMLASRWSGQVKQRANRLAEQLRTGIWQ